MYQTLSHKEKLQLLNHKETRTYKMVGHSWSPLKGVGKNYCTNCGLVALRNQFTDFCVDKGCNYDVHSSYKSARSKYSRGIDYVQHAR